MCGAGRLIKQGKGWPAKWKERWFEFDAAGDRLLYFDMAQGKKQEAEPEGGGGQALLRSTLSEMSVGTAGHATFGWQSILTSTVLHMVGLRRHSRSARPPRA